MGSGVILFCAWGLFYILAGIVLVIKFIIKEE